MKIKVKNINHLLLLLISINLLLSCKKQGVVQVKSPDGEKVFSLLESKGELENSVIDFTIKYGDKEIILPSTLELISNEIDFSGDFSILKVEESSIENEWKSRFSELSTIPNNYNWLKVYLKIGKAKLNIICRAYNEGVAFSYEIPKQNSLKEIGLDENIHYNFKENHEVWATPKREKGVLTAQGEYKKIPLNTLEEGCERPLVIDMGANLKVAFAEAKLVDFARLSFKKGNSSEFSILSSLDGKMGAQKQDTITGAIISERINRGVKVHKKLPFQSPWRVVMIAENEGELLQNNYIIQNLNDPSKITDDSWIKPGKVLRETTLTTNGGIAAINFVKKHNMQYVLFDAGWYGNEMLDSSDATTITLDPKRSKGPFDIEAVTKYAKANDIGVILYVNRRSLEKQLDELLPLFKKWGIAGIKYGFVRVGDQDATAWLHNAIKKASDYGFIVDVHDEYRPTGFSRTYPNLLTQEGIAGDETTVSNEHTLITMFTRMLAGAADNTVCYYSPKVDRMGSRASQLAKTVCLFSPLQFLYWYDKPIASPEKLDGLWGDTRHIGNEPELEFFDSVPTTWDETKVLHAKIGELGVIARRKGEKWFVGGINANNPQSIHLDFSFLKDGDKYIAKVYTDDETVNTRTKVRIDEIELNNGSSLKLDIKPNNGFAIQLSLKKENK
jgi:alpha-glucosidase